MTLAIRRAWLTAIVVVMTMALPSVALAQDVDDKTAGATDERTGDTGDKDDEESPEVATVLSTLPVLGSGLDVTITRDDDGEIESVSLDPSDGVTPLEEGDHRVSFLLSDGDTEVVIKSAEGIVQTKVKADNPADVSGDGVWSGDVFGTGTITVPYSVTFDGAIPMITVGAISAPTDVMVEVEEGELKTDDDGERSFFAVKIELESTVVSDLESDDSDDDSDHDSDDQSAVLVLVAKSRVDDDDDETRASVSATLIADDRVDCWFDRDRDRDDDDRDRDWDDDDRDRDWDNDDRDRDWDDRDRDWDDDDDRDWDDDDRDRDWDDDDRGDDDEDRSDDRGDDDDD